MCQRPAPAAVEQAEAWVALLQRTHVMERTAPGAGAALHFVNIAVAGAALAYDGELLQVCGFPGGGRWGSSPWPTPKKPVGNRLAVQYASNWYALALRKRASDSCLYFASTTAAGTPCRYHEMSGLMVSDPPMSSREPAWPVLRRREAGAGRLSPVRRVGVGATHSRSRVRRGQFTVLEGQNPRDEQHR